MCARLIPVLSVLSMNRCILPTIVVEKGIYFRTITGRLSKIVFLQLQKKLNT